MNVELVVAAYNKNIEWLEFINDQIKITVYRKGDFPKQREDEIKIQHNVGRCVHTFFNHIHKNYDTLSDYTFFVQDYPFDHWENVIDVVNALDSDVYKHHAQLSIRGYYGYHYNTITTPGPAGGCMWNLSESKYHGNGKVLVCRGNGQPHHNDPPIDIDKCWPKFFSADIPEQYEFIPGGHFGVTKEHIRLRNRSFYENVVDYLEQHKEAPWVIERLECFIFNPQVV